MHIPDGFLGPKTCIACFAVTVPILMYCWRTGNLSSASRGIVRVGSAAAFVFLLMMFNIPVPGGTTAHATGAALTAILLGPALGIPAVALALIMQALLFADGGITAFGANCLSMAICECLVASLIWSWRTRLTRNDDSFTSAFSFAAGYLAVVTGSVVTGLILGMQPVLEHENGQPLYFPIPLSVTFPAIVGVHLFTGLIEGFLTMTAIRVARGVPVFLPEAAPAPPGRGIWGFSRWTFGLMLVMILFVPAGVILPAFASSGSSWGEWSSAEVAAKAGMSNIPQGMERLSGIWKAPASDYTFIETDQLASSSIQYVGAAFVGVVATIVTCLVIYHLQQRRQRRSRLS